MNFIKKYVRKVTIKMFNLFGFSIYKNVPDAAGFTGASKILEFNYGHLESKKTRTSINLQKKPFPWFTYPAIEYLDQLDLSKKTMLEWGSGNSSLFFSERVQALTSLEHNSEWFEKVKEFGIPNQSLILATDDYATCAELDGKLFDIILIDGIKREECAQIGPSLLAKGGLIILDNSDRYPEIACKLRMKGYIEIDFHGFGPINDYTWTTSLFLDREIALEPKSIQPTIPIGGGF
ncbi:MAG: hypothetical protein ACI840_000545 [Ulvibacter sp.]|jgi:hypothetical protein